MVGTNPDYAQANVHFAQDGRFLTDADVNHATRVCVIGPDVADALFPLPGPDRPRAHASTGAPTGSSGSSRRRATSSAAATTTTSPSRSPTFDEQFPEIKNGGGDTIHIATVPRRPEDYDALIEEETAILRARRGLRPDQENDFAIFTTRGPAARTSSRSPAASPRRCW